MNNVFSLSRFGKYLQYDLVNAKNNYGLSLIISCCTPVFFYLVFLLFSYIFKSGLNNFGTGVQVTALLVSWLVVSLIGPSKLYGRLTEKRAGSDWVLIPASALEKTLSMFVVTCVVVPAVGLAVFCACDGLLSMLAPGYGPILFSGDSSDFMDGFFDASIGVGFGPAAFFVSWCSNILFFTLGAIVFKKSKVAKTILSSFALGIVLTSATSVALGGMNFDPGIALESLTLGGADSFISALNLRLNVYYVLMFAALDLAIYFRIKTIKH